MPRYNLNHDDIDIIVRSLDQLATKADSTKAHQRIMSLRDRLLLKIKDTESIDVWAAFQSKTPVQKPESL